MSNASNVVEATSGGVYGLTYQSPVDLNAAISFYQTERARRPPSP